MITQADYDELVRLYKNGYRYTARDLLRDKVYAFINKPTKYEQIWAMPGRFPAEGSKCLIRVDMEFVKWTDKSPRRIAAAIAEYERAQEQEWK